MVRSTELSPIRTSIPSDNRHEVVSSMSNLNNLPDSRQVWILGFLFCTMGILTTFSVSALLQEVAVPRSKEHPEERIRFEAWMLLPLVAMSSESAGLVFWIFTKQIKKLRARRLVRGGGASGREGGEVGSREGAGVEVNDNVDEEISGGVVHRDGMVVVGRRVRGGVGGVGKYTDGGNAASGEVKREETTSRGDHDGVVVIQNVVPVSAQSGEASDEKTLLLSSHPSTSPPMSSETKSLSSSSNKQESQSSIQESNKNAPRSSGKQTGNDQNAAPSSANEKSRLLDDSTLLSERSASSVLAPTPHTSERRSHNTPLHVPGDDNPSDFHLTKQHLRFCISGLLDATSASCTLASLMFRGISPPINQMFRGGRVFFIGFLSRFALKNPMSITKYMGMLCALTGIVVIGLGLQIWPPSYKKPIHSPSRPKTTRDGKDYSPCLNDRFGGTSGAFGIENGAGGSNVDIVGIIGDELSNAEEVSPGRESFLDNSLSSSDQEEHKGHRTPEETKGNPNHIRDNNENELCNPPPEISNQFDSALSGKDNVGAVLAATENRSQRTQSTNSVATSLSTEGSKSSSSGGLADVPPWVGILVCLIGNILRSIQFTLQEFNYRKVSRLTPPMVAVGIEGTTGVCFLFSFLLPIILVGGSMEDPFLRSQKTLLDTGIWQFSVAPEVQISFACYFAFNSLVCIVGSGITQKLSAGHRAILDCLRTIFIWIAEIPYIMVFTEESEWSSALWGKKFNYWEGCFWTEKIGFIFILFGTLFYFEVLTVCNENPVSRDNIQVDVSASTRSGVESLHVEENPRFGGKKVDDRTQDSA